jgi:hypothetical protein
MLRTQSVNVTRDRLHAGGGGHHDLSSERSLSVSGTVVLLSHVQRPSPVAVHSEGPGRRAALSNSPLADAAMPPAGTGTGRHRRSASQPGLGQNRPGPLPMPLWTRGPESPSPTFVLEAVGSGSCDRSESRAPMFGSSLGLIPPMTWPWAAWAGLGSEVSLGGSPPRQGRRATGRVPVPGRSAMSRLKLRSSESE